MYWAETPQVTKECHYPVWSLTPAPTNWLGNYQHILCASTIALISKLEAPSCTVIITQHGATKQQLIQVLHGQFKACAATVAFCKQSLVCHMQVDICAPYLQVSWWKRILPRGIGMLCKHGRCLRDSGPCRLHGCKWWCYYLPTAFGCRHVVLLVLRYR